MKNSFKYIYSFFLILSLLGLGENILTTSSYVKNIKQTEWVAKTTQTGLISNCYHYNVCSYFSDPNLNFHLWSNEFSFLYNQKLSVKLLTQAKISSNTNLIALIFNKLHTPRRSVENHKISYGKTELSLQNCLSCAIRHDVGNIKWNYLLNRKWIKQLIRTLVSSMELSV